jgi:nicotinamide-nucleotide amidase
MSLPTSPSPLGGEGRGEPCTTWGAGQCPEPHMVQGRVKMERNFLEKTIGDYLRNKGWTLSIAESCTGGLISDRITDVSGSSDYFMGGMVNYSNESKAKHLGVPSNDMKKYGAVSSQVAKRMAQGVRKAFHTTFGLSTTGVAGPTGGTKEKPVGLVFIGLAKGKKTWLKKLNLKGSRRDIKEKATEKSLEFFYEILIHSRQVLN